MLFASCLYFQQLFYFYFVSHPFKLITKRQADPLIISRNRNSPFVNITSVRSANYNAPPIGCQKPCLSLIMLKIWWLIQLCHRYWSYSWIPFHRIHLNVLLAIINDCYVYFVRACTCSLKFIGASVDCDSVDFTCSCLCLFFFLFMVTGWNVVSKIFQQLLKL